MNAAQIIEKLKFYFNVMPDKEDEQEIIEQISSGVSFRGANLWVLIFAIFIASLGLNVNSTAVIIGAMLISPLMGPIIGMGLSVGINDLELLRRSVKNYGVATLISVLTATIYFLITPLGEAQSELLARTSPTLYDVLIAFCGGAAGIIALCTRGKGNVIPGVAIATALMPPLCTAGYGLATGHLFYFLGAFYLFFINTVFIALATYSGVRLMQFRQHQFLTNERARKAKRIVMAIVILTMIPAVFMTISIVRDSIFNNKIRQFLKTELRQAGTQVISNHVDKDEHTLRLVAVGKEISNDMKNTAQERMKFYGLEEYRLNIIQGTQSDSLLQLNMQLTQVNNRREHQQQQLARLTAQNGALSQKLESYTRYEALLPTIRNEIQALFPQLKTISIAPVTEAQRDTTAMRQFIAVIIHTEGKHRLLPTDITRLHDWLQKRTQADSLIIVQQ